jgi:hypothetical protein
MITIIAGSRGITDIGSVQVAMEACGWTPSIVVSGTAGGVDTLGERWAQEQGIPVFRTPANWDKYGKRAGYLRNVEMAQGADALVAIWDGVSKGTRHMIDIARKMGLRVYIYKP